MSTNPLNDVLPARVRGAIYAIVFVAGLALAAWQATEGDWVAFAVLLTGSLTSALAGSNVEKPKQAGVRIGNGGVTAAAPAKVTLNLSSDGTNMIEAGRQIQQALDAYHRSSGK